MENKNMTLTTNPLECQGNDEVATIWMDQAEGAALIASLSASSGFAHGQEFGKRLVAAYNETYRKSINPEAVEIMLNALKFAINIKELWMPSFDETPPEHAGEMDALSRMRNVLNYAIEAATIK